MGEVWAGRISPCQSPGIPLVVLFRCVREAGNLPQVNAAARGVCAPPLCVGHRPSPAQVPALPGTLGTRRAPKLMGFEVKTSLFPSSPSLFPFPARSLVSPCCRCPSASCQVSHISAGPHGDRVTAKRCDFKRVPPSFPFIPSSPAPRGGFPGEPWAAPTHRGFSGRTPSPSPPRAGSAAGGAPALTLVQALPTKAGGSLRARWSTGRGSAVPRPVPAPGTGQGWAAAPAEPLPSASRRMELAPSRPGKGGDASLGTAVSLLEPARSLSCLSLLVSARQPGNTT